MCWSKTSEKKKVLRLELVAQNFNENLLCSVLVSYISNSTEIIRMSFWLTSSTIVMWQKLNTSLSEKYSITDAAR